MNRLVNRMTFATKFAMRTHNLEHLLDELEEPVRSWETDALGNMMTKVVENTDIAYYTIGEFGDVVATFMHSFPEAKIRWELKV